MSYTEGPAGTADALRAILNGTGGRAGVDRACTTLGYTRERLQEEGYPTGCLELGERFRFIADTAHLVTRREDIRSLEHLAFDLNEITNAAYRKKLAVRRAEDSGTYDKKRRAATKDLKAAGANTIASLCLSELDSGKAQRGEGGQTITWKPGDEYASAMSASGACFTQREALVCKYYRRGEQNSDLLSILDTLPKPLPNRTQDPVVRMRRINEILDEAERLQAGSYFDMDPLRRALYSLRNDRGLQQRVQSARKDATQSVELLQAYDATTGRMERFLDAQERALAIESNPSRFEKLLGVVRSLLQWPLRPASTS